jgi:hypothetical protein
LHRRAEGFLSATFPRLIRFQLGACPFQTPYQLGLMISCFVRFFELINDGLSQRVSLYLQGRIFLLQGVYPAE